MNLDDIIEQVCSDSDSAFFFTPPVYSKAQSFIYLKPAEIISVYDKSDLGKSLKLVEKYLSKGLTGYSLIEYEAGYLLEKRLEKYLNINHRKLMQFILFDKKNVKKVVSSEIDFGDFDEDSYLVSGFKLNTSRKKFFKDINQIKQYIAAGDTYQVNYTVKGKFNFSGSYSSFFKNLLFNQSARYSTFINNETGYIISLSPELFFRRKNKKIISKPMKGTLSRGKDIKSDTFRAFELESSEKNRAENVMIVDLVRNDLGRICKYGSVKVDNLFEIEKYESLFQMVSTIGGKLNDNINLENIFKNIFPCGSVTGAPKIRTMEIIKELENEERGIYTGAIGILAKKSSVFNVAIRTIKIDNESGRGEMGLGSGIVWDSESENEYNETLLKSEFLSSPVKPFQLIETLRIEKGSVFLFEEHIERLKKSAHYFIFNFNEKELRDSLLKIVKEKYSKRKYRLRLTLNKWGKFNFEFALIKPLSDFIKVVVSDKKVSSENRFQYFKTTNRKLYNTEYSTCCANGFFDVIFFNEKEELAEGSITNIFIRKDNTWLTPAISSGILAGIYRNYFISGRNDVKETTLSLNDLLNADEVKLVNSIRGEIKVNQLHYSNEFVEYS